MVSAPRVQKNTRMFLCPPAFQRGELQVLGRDEILSQAQYQLHPLWSLSFLWFLNLNDPSSLLSPILTNRTTG